jgi:hypothetical protein
MAAPWEALHGIADRRTSAFRRAFVEAVAAASDAVPRMALERAIRRGEYEVAFALAERAWMEAAASWRQRVAAQLRSVFTAGGEVATVWAGTQFEIVNPFAVAWVNQHAAQLVTRVTETVRTSIRAVIRDSIAGEFTVRESARLIRTLGIGLTDTQARAALRLREELRVHGYSGEEVATRVDRYRGKLLRQRAETIARTETITGATAGQLEAWRQARAKGFIGFGAQKQWIVTPDDRLCLRCRAMSGQRRALSDPFLSPDGVLVQGPTLHPNCRCAVKLIPGRASRGRTAA